MLRKPWLEALPLKSMKIEFLKKTYPLEELNPEDLSGKDLDGFNDELEYIKTEVVPKRNLMIDSKTDYDVLMDVRYFNKYHQNL